MPETRADLVERAREEAHLVTVLVDLDARAVQLRLEGGRSTEIVERLLDRARRLREHRRERAADLEPERVERAGASAHRRCSDRGQITTKHRRTTDLACLDASRRRDRVDHHAGERPLAQIAREQAAQEDLLELGRVRHHVQKKRRASGLRARARCLRHFGERAVHLCHRERRRGRRRRHRGERGPADADAALQELPREPRHDDGHVLGVRGAQSRRESLRLRRARARHCDLRRSFRHVCQARHVSSSLCSIEATLAADHGSVRESGRLGEVIAVPLSRVLHDTCLCSR